jgi:uncharacterized protein (TIGR00661 family)
MKKINTHQDLSKTATEAPRILVAPLDWGLGHATRCIPVIYELQKQGADVWLAGEGAQKILLQKEFPDLPFLELKGYRVGYAKSAIGLVFNIFSQIPRLLYTIRAEHRWLKKVVQQHGFQAIVSDNRYGLYHRSIPSVFITHQLLIKNPFRQCAERLLQKINYRYINRFNYCWIPDQEGLINFAGELSHPVIKPTIPVTYTGILSRLTIIDTKEKTKHLFISISGPEPQRSILENKIVEEVSHYNGTATIVRGLPGNEKMIPSTNDIQFHNHLSAEDYAREMQQASLVICRSGYSTIMDIFSMQKKAVFIPTPGQSEQEYLANYLTKKEMAASILQKDFSLANAIQLAQDFLYQIPAIVINTELSKAVAALLNEIKK